MKYIIRKVVEYGSIVSMLKVESGANIHEITIIPYDREYTDDKSLTPKQKALLEFLYLKKDNFPSLKEIAHEMNVKAISPIVKHLNALEKKGYIMKQKHRKRFYKLLK